MFFFFDDSEKTLHELLEVLSKGIDLLANDNLAANLYEAYEKYVIATIKLVDNSYCKNYTKRFEEKDFFSSYHFTSALRYSPPRIDMSYKTSFGNSEYNQGQYLNPFIQNYSSVNYKEKLKVLLQKIIIVVKEITSE